MPLPQRDAELEAGEVRAEAAVDAAAEGQVAVGLAVPDELPGVGELGLVDVGGAEERHHLLALADREAVDLGVAGGDPRRSP